MGRCGESQYLLNTTLVYIASSRNEKHSFASGPVGMMVRRSVLLPHSISSFVSVYILRPAKLYSKPIGVRAEPFVGHSSVLSGHVLLDDVEYEKNSGFQGHLPFRPPPSA